MPYEDWATDTRARQSTNVLVAFTLLLTRIKGGGFGLCSKRGKVGGDKITSSLSLSL